VVDVKHAVAAVVEFIKDLLEPRRANDILLEEVELSQKDGDREVWLIAISFPRAVTLSDGLFNGRDYKTFTVDAETGQVQAMRIRELANSR
jgi:hypothetical protein